MKILALDINKKSIKSAISDLDGNIENLKVSDSPASEGAQALLEKLIETIHSYEDFDKIAISTVGKVDRKSGIIIQADKSIEGYEGTKLKEILEERFKKTVELESHENALALSEKHFGRAKETENFLCVTYGHLIGGAIVIDSKLYRGQDGLAGDFGNIITHRFKDKYTKGFYNRYASEKELILMGKVLSQDYASVERIYEEFEKGNPSVVRVMEDWTFELCIGLVSLINTFNPSKIIVGGGIMEEEKIVKMVEEKLKSMLQEGFGELEIMQASLGDKAALVGAASLYI